MGGTQSIDLDTVEFMVSKSNASVLRMSPGDINSICQMYHKILIKLQRVQNLKDVKSLEVSASLLLRAFDIVESKFKLKIFSIVGSLDSNIDFQKFLFYLWNYCTLGEDEFGMCTTFGG